MTPPDDTDMAEIYVEVRHRRRRQPLLKYMGFLPFVKSDDSCCTVVIFGDQREKGRWWTVLFDGVKREM